MTCVDPNRSLIARLPMASAGDRGASCVSWAGRAASIRSAACCLIAVLLLTLCGCGGSSDNERKPLFTTDPDPKSDSEHATIVAEIAQLSNSKASIDNADASKAYDEAKTKLIARGSAIENELVEALEGNPDWGVRLGAIEVLDASGTRICIPALIGALQDSQPIVALYANDLLVALCKHNEIPAPDAKVGANGLPAVPVRPKDGGAVDADVTLWTTWYQAHHDQLHKAWEDWWTANKDKVKID